MRLLDCIVDGNILNERLFAVLDAAPLPVSSSLKYTCFAFFTFLMIDEEEGSLMGSLMLSVCMCVCVCVCVCMFVYTF
jgi:hypothetical protein